MIALTHRSAATRTTTVVVALLAAFGLVAGCSKSEEPKNDAPLPAANTLIAASSASAKSLKDVHIDLAVDGTVPKLPVKSVNAYITTEPQLGGQGDADVTYSGAQIQAKFVVVGGTLWAQLAPGQAYSDMGNAANIYDASAILDPNRGIANLISSVRDPKVEDREQIGGVDTVRLSGIIPNTALAGIVPNSTLGDRSVSFWIQEAAPNNLVRANIGFDTGTLTVTLSDWGVKQTLIDPKTAK